MAECATPRRAAALGEGEDASRLRLLKPADTGCPSLSHRFLTLCRTGADALARAISRQDNAVVVVAAPAAANARQRLREKAKLRAHRRASHTDELVTISGAAARRGLRSVGLVLGSRVAADPDGRVREQPRSAPVACQ